MDAKTIADARNFLRSFRSLLAFADAIDQIGTVESDMVALRASYEELLKSISNAKAELEAIRTEAANASDEATAIKNEARKEAKRVKDQANIAAVAAVKKADEDCKVLVEKARASAANWDQRVAAAAKEFEKKQAELVEVEKQLASAKEQLKELLARFG